MSLIPIVVISNIIKLSLGMRWSWFHIILLFPPSPLPFRSCDNVNISIVWKNAKWQCMSLFEIRHVPLGFFILFLSKENGGNILKSFSRLSKKLTTWDSDSDRMRSLHRHPWSDCIEISGTIECGVPRSTVPSNQPKHTRVHIFTRWRTSDNWAFLSSAFSSCKPWASHLYTFPFYGWIFIWKVDDDGCCRVANLSINRTYIYQGGFAMRIWVWGMHE